MNAQVASRSGQQSFAQNLRGLPRASLHHGQQHAAAGSAMRRGHLVVVRAFDGVLQRALLVSDRGAGRFRFVEKPFA